MRMFKAISSRIFAVLWLVATISGGASAEGDRRIALVVGNSAYANVPQLRNPRNDATAVAAALRRLGFEVLLHTDVTHAGMAEPIAEFVAMLRGADAAVFYYAGHALSYDGRNYIVPVDANAQSYIHVKFQMTPLDAIVEEMASLARVSIVLLDACRDNPIAQQIVRSLQAETRNVTVGRGLAAMDPPGREMLIAYATKPGAVAEDGSDTNSPFTRALLEQLESDGSSIEDMLKNVRRTVRERTGNRQEPEYVSRLDTRFAFKPGASMPLPPRPEPAPGGLSTYEQAREEALYWESVRDLGDPALVQSYLDKYPNGKFANVARTVLSKLRAGPPAGAPLPNVAPPASTASRPNADAEYEALLGTLDDTAIERFIREHPGDARGAALKRSLAEKKGWSAAETANTVESYERFLLNFPTGTFAGIARERMARLAQERWAAQNPPKRIEVEPAPVERPPAQVYVPPPVAPSFGTFSPSFNCEEDKGDAEQAVCRSQLLSQLDVEMAERYQLLKGRLASSMAKQLRDTQRDWLKGRDSCGSDGVCIERMYRQRIQQLIEWGG